MRFAVISDIHSNFEALKAVYKVLKKKHVDYTVCLGDVVGYGAKPKECIDFVREHNIITVKGNHDHYVAEPRQDWPIQTYAKDAIFWTQDTLDQEEITWLKELPFDYEQAGISFIHASLECHNGDYWPYILGTKSATFHFFFQKGKYAFFGHTHIPLLFTQHEGAEPSIELLSSKMFDTVPERVSKFLINPGSVGQPRDFDCRASFAIFDDELEEIEHIRVEYDIQKTQKEIIEAGLPEMLAERLSRGK